MNPISLHTRSFFKEKIVPILTALNKKIFVVASIIFGCCLAGVWYVRRYHFKAVPMKNNNRTNSPPGNAVNKNTPPIGFQKIQDKAEKIKERTQSIEDFHKNRGITSDTLAIPLDVLKDVPHHKKDVLSKVIDDINQVIENQTKKQKNLVIGREWRMSMDNLTNDSNRNNNIRNHFSLIRDVLLPVLKKRGIIHSILSSKEAESFDIRDRRKNLQAYDLIVQF